VLLIIQIKEKERKNLQFKPVLPHVGVVLAISFERKQLQQVGFGFFGLMVHMIVHPGNLIGIFSIESAFFFLS